MALPASGQISSGDIRSELGLNISNFSFAQAAYGEYVGLNAGSPSVPPNSGQIDISDWYSYCHTCGESCGSNVYSVTYPEYVVIDLGTSFGKVNFSGNTSNCSGCLVEDTKILSDNLEKISIQNLSVGQRIFNGLDYNIVSKIYPILSDKLYRFNDGLLESSQTHNHYIQNTNGAIEIKTSDEVNIGDSFMKVDGTLINIYKIEVIEGEFELYNIESTGNKLYVANDIITHNKCNNAWWIYQSYPYDSSGSITASTYVTGSTCNSTFTGNFNYSQTSGRYAYFKILCPTQSAQIQMDCPTINLYWSFSQGADSGSFEITVNSSQVVYETTTNSGNISVSYGDNISVNVASNMGFGYTYADATTTIIEDGSTVCTDTQSSNPTAYSSCSRTVAGFDLEVYGSAAQV